VVVAVRLYVSIIKKSKSNFLNFKRPKIKPLAGSTPYLRFFSFFVRENKNGANSQLVARLERTGVILIHQPHTAHLARTHPYFRGSRSHVSRGHRNDGARKRQCGPPRCAAPSRNGTPAPLRCAGVRSDAGPRPSKKPDVSSDRIGAAFWRPRVGVNRSELAATRGARGRTGHTCRGGRRL
jgi:hypothetical protein